jgi:hypothetical protein
LLEAVYARLQPLAKVLRVAEKNVVDARAGMQQAQLESTSLEHIVKVGQRVTAFADLRRRIEAAHLAIATKQTGQESAVQNLARVALVLAEQTTATENARQANATASAEAAITS